jgi:hypothetical protein
MKSFLKSMFMQKYAFIPRSFLKKRLISAKSPEHQVTLNSREGLSQVPPRKIGHWSLNIGNYYWGLKTEKESVEHNTIFRGVPAKA